MKKSKKSSEEANLTVLATEDDSVEWEDLVAEERAELEAREKIELSAGKKKFRKGSATTLALVATVFGFVAVIFSVFFSFEGSSVQQSSNENNIHVDVTIVASAFQSATSNSVCRGTGPISGIVGSILTLKQPSSHLQLSTPLSGGSLTQSGSCLYSIVFSPPANFAGGKVSASIAFPFGTAPATTFDLLSVLPFPRFPITIDLS